MRALDETDGGRQSHIHRVELVTQRLDDDPVRSRSPSTTASLEGGPRHSRRGARRSATVGTPTDLDLLLREPLDVSQQPLLARLSERDRHALPSGPPHPADAVDIYLRRGRNVVVDHVREVLDVEPAAATSVATTVGAPATNFLITRSRCSWEIPPCSASAP